MTTTSSILAENRHRNELINRPFDPISGLNSTGRRNLLEISDLTPARMWIPESMEQTPLIIELRRHGSVVKTAAARGGARGHNTEILCSRIADEFDRLRMLHDFPYWAARYCYIKTKGGGPDSLFRLNRPQRMLVEKLESLRLAARPIRLILLKARQWGGSTCVQLYMAWLQLVHQEGLNSLLIAHQGVATDEIKDMFDRMVDAYPTRLLHDIDDEWSEDEKKLEGVGKSRALYRMPQRNCKIKIGSAERPDSCRGGDYNLVHCSEVGIWKATNGKTPEMLARSACAGVLLQPGTMIVYESTANGTGNFFHREYQAALTGESQFEPLFISWFDIDQYAAPLDDAEAFAQMLLDGRFAEGAVSDRRQPGAYLWWLWTKGATLEAINWYIAERSKYSEHGMMAAEYPSDEVEAFVHSGTRVFDKYKVEALRPDCRVPSFIGEIDSALTAPCGAEVRTGRYAALFPTELPRVRFTPLPSGSWQIWEMPDKSEPRLDNRYIAVVDVGGRSSRSDWSVIAIFDRRAMYDGDGRPRLVAQWRGHTDFDLLALRAAMGASFYDNALLVIESNTLETHEPQRDVEGNVAPFLLNRLRDIYPNLYARRQSEEDMMIGAPRKYGFHTNVATKPMIIATLVKVIREGLYVERDERCLNEFLSYERTSTGAYAAIAGCHDDLLMTRAIALHLSFHELPLPEPAASTNYRYTPRPLTHADF